MEGARWNWESHKIAASLPKELFVLMPLIHIIPMPNRVMPESGMYVCPTYRCLDRRGMLSTTGASTNFVTDIEVPAEEE
jgi:dynein heavy chain